MNAPSCGEGGIRTLGRLAPTPVFETGPIGRSGTSPSSSRVIIEATQAREKAALAAFHAGPRLACHGKPTREPQSPVWKPESEYLDWYAEEVVERDPRH